LPSCHNKSWRNKHYNKKAVKNKRQLEENDVDEDEEEYENNEDERKLPAKQHNNNEEEEEDDDDNDNDDDNKNDNDVVDDNLRCSLPNCTHKYLDDLYNVSSKNEIKHTLQMELVGR